MKKFTFMELEDIASAHGAYVELRPDLMPALRLSDRSLIIATYANTSGNEPTYSGFKLIGQKNIHSARRSGSSSFISIHRWH